MSVCLCVCVATPTATAKAGARDMQPCPACQTNKNKAETRLDWTGRMYQDKKGGGREDLVQSAAMLHWLPGTHTHAHTHTDVAAAYCSVATEGRVALSSAASAASGCQQEAGILSRNWFTEQKGISNKLSVDIFFV